MRHFTVIPTLLICLGIHIAVCQTDRRLPDDDSSQKETETGHFSLYDSLSIYGTVMSVNPADRDLQACCSKEASTPGLDFVFLVGRRLYGFMRWITVTMFDKFTGGGGEAVKIVQTQPALGEGPTFHETHTFPSSYAPLEMPAPRKHTKDGSLTKIPMFETTPRQVICKCGRQRGCNEKLLKPPDGPKIDTKSLTKIISKHLPDPLVWLGLGIIAGFAITLFCQVTQRAANRSLQKQTVKEMCQYIFLAMKESNLFSNATATTTAATIQRRQRLPQRTRRGMSARHLRPRPSSDLDRNNLLETRPTELAPSQASLATANRSDGVRTESTPLPVDSSDKDVEKSGTEQEESSSQLQPGDSHPHCPGSPSFGESRSSEAEARQEVSEVKEPMSTDMVCSSSSWCVPDPQIPLPLVDPVWPSGSQWLDSDDYSDAHSIHKITLSSNSKTSLCSSLGDEMRGPWVSTSLSFIVYDLDIIEDIPDEVLEVLSCDERPCSLHPHHRYHYFGRKVIVQRLPLLDKATSTTFIPSIELKVESLIRAFAEECRAKSEEEQHGLDSGASIERLMLDDSRSGLTLSIDRTDFADRSLHESDQEIYEADNTASGGDTFVSIEDIENIVTSQTVNVETSGTSLFTIMGAETLKSPIEESKKMAKEFLNKFEDIGSIVKALKEVIDFCTTISDQQTAGGKFAQTEVSSEHFGASAIERTTLLKTLPSMPLQSHNRSFSLEKVLAVKAALDETSPDIRSPRKESLVSSQLSSSFQETIEDGHEVQRSMLAGRPKPKICTPAARAASADFYGDAVKSVSRDAASDCPDREALFRDLKEKVASKRLGKSGVSMKDAQQDAPSWENSDASLLGQRSDNLLSKGSDSTRNYFDIRSAFERMSKGNSPIEPPSPRNMKDNVGLMPSKTAERKKEEQNIILVPFAFPVSSKGPESPSSQASSSHKSYEEFEEKPPSLHNSQRTSPFESHSKVSLNEPSSPWEVSTCAKKGVFSPVGWSSKRSEIGSLFRATASEKVHETSGQGPTVVSSPRSRGTEASGKASKLTDTSSPLDSILRSSRSYDPRRECPAVHSSDLNLKRRRLGDDSEIRNKVLSVKADKTPVDQSLVVAAEKEKNKQQIIEIPVVYRVQGVTNKNSRNQSSGVHRTDLTDTLHQPRIISKEKVCEGEEGVHSGKRLILSSDPSNPEFLLTGKPPLPRDSRTGSLQGSRHTAHNCLTGSPSKRSSPRSPRKDEEEEGKESGRDSVNEIDEELKRQIRDMTKAGRLLQDLIRKKSESSPKASKHKDEEACESKRPSPRPRTYTRGSSQINSGRTSPREDNRRAERNRRRESSNKTAITNIYHEAFHTGNQDRSDSSQASSGYASVAEKDGPIIDILMPASSDMLRSTGLNQYLGQGAAVVSTADSSDAGDYLGQAGCMRNKVSKIPILANMREGRRHQFKVKRNTIETKEETKEEIKHPASQSTVRCLDGHLLKPRGMEDGYVCKMKTLLPDRPLRIANAQDARPHKDDASCKESFLTSPRKISRTAQPKRVSPLIAQKIGLLKQSITERSSQPQERPRNVGKLYAFVEPENFTDNASVREPPSLTDSGISVSDLNKQMAKVGKSRPVIVPRRPSCLPRLKKRVISSSKEENFSQNHIVSLSSSFTRNSKEDLLLCPSPDTSSAGPMDRPSRTPQDTHRMCIESPQMNVQAHWKCFSENDERSHLGLDIFFGPPFPGEMNCKSLSNCETTELQQNTAQHANLMEELRQWFIQRGVNFDTSTASENLSFETTISRSKSDSDVGYSSQPSSLVHVASFNLVSTKQKGSWKSEKSTSDCDWPLTSGSLQSGTGVMEDLLLEDSFLSEQCSLLDKANTPELVSIIGSPQANSTVDEDDENIQMASQESSYSPEAVSDEARGSPTAFVERHQVQIINKDTGPTADNKGTLDTPGEAQEPQENGSSGRLLSSEGLAGWSVHRTVRNPMGMGKDVPECDDVDLPLAGSPDMMAVLPGMAADLAMRNTEGDGDAEHLAELEAGETLPDLSVLPGNRHGMASSQDSHQNLGKGR